ncbi:MAG: lactonase family protein [Chloroflexia bacterium]|nr:lactonase family protein [Chloroflexia bacterium]
MFIYAGAYTEPPLGTAEGIAVFRFDLDSGALRPVQVVAGVANPSFLAFDTRQTHLYAVNELGEGTVSAFARDPVSGELTALNRELSHGADPCYISLAPGDRFALVANYTGGTVAVLPIAADGRLAPATSVIRYTGSGSRPEQEGPHPHMIALDGDGRYVLVSDLGGDRLYLYRLDTGMGDLVPNEEGMASVAAVAGDGPRHFAFAPDGRHLYAINELASTLTVYSYDGERGVLRPVQTVATLPDGFTGENSCAHVVVSPDGRFVYGSNRGHDSIAIWAIDGEGGTVVSVGHEPTRGKTPRGFAIDPSGSWLVAANQDSGTIVTFRRDRESGTLSATGDVTETPSPVAILFSQM